MSRGLGADVRHVWENMRSRCQNPNNPSFRNYGGRGIYVCQDWQDFETFAKDMGPRPPGFTLDRIDNDGPYAPWNCRWTDWKSQCRNQRKTSKVEIEGVTYLALELADIAGKSASTIIARAARGLPYNLVIASGRVGPDDPSKPSRTRWAAAVRTSHCPHGHEYTAENTMINARGSRECRACVRAKNRDYARRKRMEMKEAK